MNLQKQVNFYLGVKYIKTPIYSDNEVKKLIGVSMSELRHLWIFSSRNYFKEAVDNLIHNNVKIDFKEANRVRKGGRNGN
jgi:hypothetical protein